MMYHIAQRVWAETPGGWTGLGMAQGRDHQVSGLAKMAWDWTRPNFPNTSPWTHAAGDDVSPVAVSAAVMT